MRKLAFRSEATNPPLAKNLIIGRVSDLEAVPHAGAYGENCLDVSYIGN